LKTRRIEMSRRKKSKTPKLERGTTAFENCLLALNSIRHKLDGVLRIWFHLGRSDVEEQLNLPGIGGQIALLAQSQLVITLFQFSEVWWNGPHSKEFSAFKRLHAIKALVKPIKLVRPIICEQRHRIHAHSGVLEGEFTFFADVSGVGTGFGTDEDRVYIGHLVAFLCEHTIRTFESEFTKVRELAQEIEQDLPTEPSDWFDSAVDRAKAFHDESVDPFVT